MPGTGGTGYAKPVAHTRCGAATSNGSAPALGVTETSPVQVDAGHAPVDEVDMRQNPHLGEGGGQSADAWSDSDEVPAADDRARTAVASAGREGDSTRWSAGRAVNTIIIAAKASWQRCRPC